MPSGLISTSSKSTGACRIAAASGENGAVERPWKDEDQSMPLLDGAEGTGSDGAGASVEGGGAGGLGVAEVDDGAGVEGFDEAAGFRGVEAIVLVATNDCCLATEPIVARDSDDSGRRARRALDRILANNWL